MGRGHYSKPIALWNELLKRPLYQSDRPESAGVLFGRRFTPKPAAGTWGGPAPTVPPAVALAALEGDLAAKVQALASEPTDGLAAALARLGRAFMARDS